MREILTDPMEFGKVVLEEKKSIKKMKMEKSPSAVLVCIHIFISGSIISSAERKVVDRKSP
jgi:hypothetical protein